MGATAVVGAAVGAVGTDVAAAVGGMVGAAAVVGVDAAGPAPAGISGNVRPNTM